MNQFLSVESSTDECDLSEFIIFVPIIIPKILNFVMINNTHLSGIKDLNEYFKESKIFEDEHIVDIFQIQVASPEYLLIIHSNSLFKFFEKIHYMFDEQGIQVKSTKCVLRLWKYCGLDLRNNDDPTFTYDFDDLEDDNTIKNNFVSEIVFNEVWNNPETFDNIENFKHSANYQLPEHLDKKIIHDNLDFGTDVFQFVSNRKSIEKYVYKLSIKLERKKWLKILLMLKSLPGKKEDLESCIKKEILGIKINAFSRKYYMIRGLFDFIIYVDCYDIGSLAQLRKDLTKILFLQDKELVYRFQSYIEVDEKNLGSAALPLKLDQADLDLLDMIIPNSKGLKEDIKNPCQLFYEDITIKLPDEVKYSLEMHIETLVHAFIRFRVRNSTEFIDKWNKIKIRKKMGMIRIFNPISNPLNFMCIVISINLRTLFWFIKHFDKSCSFISVSLIHKQGFYEKKMDEKTWIKHRCKPCLKHSKAFNCEGCKWYSEFYPELTLEPPNNEEIRLYEVDFKYPENYIEPFIIGLVKARLNLLDIYRNGDLENPILPPSYENNILEKLKLAINKGAQIVIFPELTIPRKELLNDMKLIIEKECKNKDIIVVAGSHYIKQNEKYFNQAPIIFYTANHPYSKKRKIKIYHATKCVISSIETQYHNNIYNEKIYTGNGVLVFKNTPFGNFGVLICRDFLNPDIVDKIIPDLDLLIIISANNSDNQFKNKLCGKASEKYSFITYINNEYFQDEIEEDANGFFGPIEKFRKKVKEEKNYTTQIFDIEKYIKESKGRKGQQKNIMSYEKKEGIIYGKLNIKELRYFKKKGGHGPSKDRKVFYENTHKSPEIL